MTRLRLPAVLLVLALVAAGCGGPKPKLTFGGKAVPVNVSFGKPGEDDPRSRVPTELAPVPSGFGVIPVPVGRQTTFVTEPPPPPAGPPKALCRIADPTDPKDLPKTEAGRDFGGPPKNGVLPFRVDGSYTEDGDKVEYRGVLTRVVSNARTEPDGSIHFTVGTFGGKVAATSDYVSTQATDRIPGAFALASISATGADLEGRPTFKAVKPLTQMQMRPTPGLAFNDASTDPLTGSAYTVSGKVIGKSRVDACGQLIDAWQVTLEQRFVTPLQRVESQVNYWVATQYGGLIVKEAVHYTGTAGTTEFQGAYEASVLKDPGV